MRCFFMKAGRIFAVEQLTTGSDAELIQEAQEAFNVRGPSVGADGFEVWDQTRFIYRFVVEGNEQQGPAKDGLKGPPGLLERIVRGWPLKFSGGATPAGGMQWHGAIGAA